MLLRLPQQLRLQQLLQELQQLLSLIPQLLKQVLQLRRLPTAGIAEVESLLKHLAGPLLFCFPLFLFPT